MGWYQRRDDPTTLEGDTNALLQKSKMVDKNRVAYSLSSVMLFNAKIGKHNYSFSLKHKFNLQTAFRSPAQSSVLILHSNCSRAHSWPWSQSFVKATQLLHLSNL